MIFKNGDRYDLTAEDLQCLNGKKSGFVFRTMIKVIKNRGKGIYGSSVAAPVIYIETIFKTVVDGNSTEWRYADGYPDITAKGAATIKTYNPELLNFQRSGKMTVEEMDKAWFLLNSPRCRGGEHQDKSKKPKFYLENKHKESEFRVNAAKTKSAAIAMVLNPEADGGLGDDQNRLLVKHFGLSTEMNLSNEQNQDYLVTFIEKGKVVGQSMSPAKALIHASNTALLRASAVVQNCIEASIICFRDQVMTYYWINDGQINPNANIFAASVADPKLAKVELINFLLTETEGGYLKLMEKRLELEPAVVEA